MKPRLVPSRFLCAGMTSRCSALISGITMGTSGVKRLAELLDTTGISRFRISFFEAPCLLFIHIDGAEDEVHALCDFVYVLFRVENGEGGECGGNGPFKRPFSADGFPIRLSPRSAPKPPAR